MSRFSSLRWGYSLAFLPLLAIGAAMLQSTASTSTLSTLSVDTLQDVVDANDGQLSLREAVTQANAAQVDTSISFQKGLAGTIHLTQGKLTLSHGVSIAGPTEGGGIVLDAALQSQIFAVEAGVVASLQYLTLQNGGMEIGPNYSSTMGGAISNKGNLTVLNCTFIGNQAARYSSPGGPPGSCGGRAGCPGIAFSGNGGAIYNHYNANLLVENCTFVGNKADQGNAIYNTCEADRYNPPLVKNSTFTGNRASRFTTFNGTIFNSVNGRIGIYNCLLAGNATTEDIRNLDGSIYSSNNINDLSAAQAGLEVDSNGAPLLKNNGGTTPTIALVEGGLAVGYGDNANLPASSFDQRGSGFPRLQGEQVDAGAYELKVVPTPTPTPLPTATPAPLGISVEGQVFSSEPNSTFTASVSLPLPNAQVRLEQAGATTQTTTTNSQGSYRFQGLSNSKGNYSVRVVAIDPSGVGVWTPLPIPLSQVVKITKKTDSNAKLVLPRLSLYSVWGKVTAKPSAKSKTAVPLADASVQINSIASKTIPAFSDTTTTDENGYYLFSYLGRARYKLAASTIAQNLTFARNGASLTLPGSKRYITPSTTYDFVGITKSSVKLKSTGRASIQTS